MEQGNEGDGIILISLKQIVPSIGADVIALSQISQERLIQIIAKALDLITQGEAQVHFTMFSVSFINRLLVPRSSS